MQILNIGEYTGEIVQKTQVDDTVITNTLYSPKQSNPDWHYHRNLHICFVFQGGKPKPVVKPITQLKKEVFSFIILKKGIVGFLPNRYPKVLILKWEETF